MDKLGSPIIVLVVAGVFGYLSINAGQFESFVIMMLAFILAKQFEKRG